MVPSRGSRWFFLRCFEEPPAVGEYGSAVMPQFGNVPSGTLVSAAEKLVATMSENELATALEERVEGMPSDALAALVGSVFEAFRDRGESSEDAAEASGVALDRIERADPAAVASLVRYAGRNIGVLKEATTLFVQTHPSLVDALPTSVTEGIFARLAST